MSAVSDREIRKILAESDAQHQTNQQQARKRSPPPAPPPSKTGAPPFQKMATTVAGLVSGIASVVFTHPLDVIKTRMQVSDGAGFTPQYSSTKDAFVQIVRNEGARGLYAGLGPAVIASSLSWGLYFSLYDMAKKRHARSSETGTTNAQSHFWSAVEAGCVATAITNPLWVLKTRMELQRRTVDSAARSATSALGGAFAPTPGQITDAAGRVLSGVAGTRGGVASSRMAASLGVPAEPVAPENYRNTLDALRTIWQREGLRGFYRGLVPSLILVGHGSIQLAVYEELRAFAIRLKTESLGPSGGRTSGGESPSKPISSMSSGAINARDSNLSKLGFLEIGLVSLLSKVAASTATYPLQVARSRLQQRFEGRLLEYRGLWDVMSSTVRREGVGALYKGLGPNLLRVAPQSAVTFITYELMMDFMHGLPVGRSGDQAI